MRARPERRYYALRAVSTPGFMVPVLTLFLVHHGVSYATLGLAGAVTAAVVVLAEVPTGYLSDRVGRRATIATSQGLFALNPLIIVTAPNRTGTLVAFAVLGLAETLQSGAVSAWCYDALDAADRSEAYRAVASRGSAIRFATLAVTAILGGLMYAVEPSHPIYAAALMGVLGVGFALSLDASGEEHTSRSTGVVDDPLGPREALTIAREYLWLPEVRWFLVIVATAFAVARSVKAFVQPVAVAGLEPLLAGVTVAGYPIPETAVLGVAYAGFAATASVASEHADAIATRLGTARTVLVVTVVDGAVMLAVLIHPVLVLPLMVLHRGAGSILVPVKNAYLHEHVDGVGRATVLSATSLVVGLAKIPVTTASGIVGDHAGPVTAIAALGGLLLVSTIGVHAFARPVKTTTEGPAPAD